MDGTHYNVNYACVSLFSYNELIPHIKVPIARIIIH